MKDDYDPDSDDIKGNLRYKRNTDINKKIFLNPYINDALDCPNVLLIIVFLSQIGPLVALHMPCSFAS